MKKKNLFITVVTMCIATIALSGCGNKKSASANVTDGNIDAEKVITTVKEAPKKTSEKKVEKSTTSNPVTSENKVKVESTQAPAEKTKPVQVQKKVAPVTTDNVRADIVTGLDQVTLKQIVNVAMGYVASKTDMPAMTNGYWDFAKTTWGIKDDQVLVQTGVDNYQIFSQGSEQYELNIKGDDAVITARSNYTQVTKTITIDINSMTITSSTY